MKNPIRLVIAEDHPIVRESLRNLLSKETQIVLLAEARDGEEALALIEQHLPDVALLDISMGQGDGGFEVAQKLQRLKLPVKVIYMTGQDHSDTILRDFVQRALALEADGFVVKSSSSDEIIESIKSVATGLRHFGGRLTPYLLDLHDRKGALERQYPMLKEMTEQERRILLLLAEAKTSKEIAAALDLSHRTVENYLSEIRDKLNLKGRHHLMKFAIEHRAELFI